VKVVDARCCGEVMEGLLIENRFVVEDEVDARRAEDVGLLLRHIEDRLRVVNGGLLIEERPIVEDQFLMSCILRVVDDTASHGGEVTGLLVEDGELRVKDGWVRR
jgi:hypothetical protein